MPDNGKIMFGQTLHDNPSDPWQEVLADGDKIKMETRCQCGQSKQDLIYLSNST